MQVKLAEMELQALWYLDSLERIFGDGFHGESAARIWMNVAMHVTNMVDAVGDEREVPASLVRGLVDKCLVEKIARELFRITPAGKETLNRVVPEGIHRAKPMHFIVTPLNEGAVRPFCESWRSSEDWTTDPRVVSCDECLHEMAQEEDAKRAAARSRA